MPDREARIDAVAFDPINLIKSKYLSRGPDFRPSDLGPTAEFFALDGITDLIYGETFGYVTKNNDVLSSLQNVQTILALHFLAAPFLLLAKLPGHSWMFKMAGRMVLRFGLTVSKGDPVPPIFLSTFPTENIRI